MMKKLFSLSFLMDKLFYLMTMVFVAVKISVHTYVFPGYKSGTMLLFSIGVLALSLLTMLFDFDALVDWRGAAIASVILLILFLIGRKEID